MFPTKRVKVLFSNRKKKLLAEAIFHENKLHDISFMGFRTVIGVIFIAHGVGKFNPGFVNFLTGSVGMPAEMQIPIALAETAGGIILIIGVLNRIIASILTIDMLGAIFIVRGASNLTGQGGYELDLILLSGLLVIIVAGPGRVSLAHIVKKIPRPLH